MMNTLSLGIVTDEISADFDTALGCAKQWGISLFELRCVGAGRVPDISAEDAQKIEDAVRTGGITITALSPGMFKHRLTQSEDIERELKETLPRTIDMAKRFGARMIIVFGFKRAAEDGDALRPHAIEYLKRAADIAAASDMVIAIENEPGFWCDTGERTAAIISEIGSKHLRVNWDPANALGTDEVPYPDGYRALKGCIANVHVKDTIEGSLLKCVPVGEGRIAWKEQIAALMEDGIVEHVTIETHCLPLIAQSEKNIRTVRQYMDDAHSTH